MLAGRAPGRNSVQAGDSLSMRESWKACKRTKQMSYKSRIQVLKLITNKLLRNVCINIGIHLERCQSI